MTMKPALIIIALTLIVTGIIGIHGRNRNIERVAGKMETACFYDNNSPACKGWTAAYVKASQSFTGNE